MRRSVVPLSVLLATLQLGGCYAYVPVGMPSETRSGQKVRVHLSDAGLAEVTPALGPGVSMLQGAVLDPAADSLTLAVSTVRTRNRGELFWNGQALTLSRSSIDAIEGQRLSRWRTVAAVAAFGMAAWLVGKGELSGSRPVEDGGTRPGGGSQQ